MVDALRAGEVVTGGGAEFADETVEVMDLYRAGHADRGLKRFLDEVSYALRQLG